MRKSSREPDIVRQEGCGEGVGEMAGQEVEVINESPVLTTHPKPVSPIVLTIPSFPPMFLTGATGLRQSAGA